MLDFIQNWWGMISVAILVIIYMIRNWQKAKHQIMALIFEAEGHARKYALETGAEKMQWVLEQGYKYLPKWLTFVLTEQMYKDLVQKIFNSVNVWLKERFS